MSQTTTAVSELLIVATGAWATRRLWARHHRGAAGAIAGIASTALLGAARYAGEIALAPLHDWAAWVATIAVFPAFCWACCAAWMRRRPVTIVETIGVTAALVLVAGWLARPPLVAPGGWPVAAYPTGIGAVGLVLVVVGAWRSGSRAVLTSALAGVVLYGLAGLVVGTEGAWRGILRVDLYHGCIAAANVFLAVALADARGDAARVGVAHPR